MVTFKKFLQENGKVVTPWASKNVTLTEALDFLSGYSDAQIKFIVKDHILYRGFSGAAATEGSGGIIIDASTGYRLSKDTNNAYVVLMDASTGLSDVPSRSRSLICTPRKSYADEFGHVRCIIPAPNTEMAYINEQDLFDVRFRIKELGLNYSINVDGLSADINQIFVILGSRSPRSPHPGGAFKSISDMNAYFNGFTDDEISLATALAFMGELQELHALSDSIIRDMSLTEEQREAFHTIVSAVHQHSDSYSILKANQFYSRAATSMLEYLRNDSKLPWAKKVVDVVTKVKGMGGPRKFFENLANSTLTKTTLGINTTTDLNTVVDAEGECWFSGKALVMSEDVFHAVKTELRKRLSKDAQ